MSTFTLKACLFDLDGVIVHTAQYHFLTWQRVAHTLGVDFTVEHNEHLKGVSRKESLQYILELGNIEMSPEDQEEWCAKKNEWYVEEIKALSPSDSLQGVLSLIEEMRSQGIKSGLGSASKNARFILERLEITDLFDVIIDGTNTTKSKPDPQVFLLGAAALQCAPENIVVFEDALAGIEAARRGGFIAVGVGDAKILNTSHFTLPGFNEITLNDLLRYIYEIEI